MAVIRITLSRAHRAAERLSKMISDMREQITKALKPARMQGFAGDGQARSIGASKALAGNNMTEVRRLSEALFAIRRAAGEANAAAGVNGLLAKMEFLRRELQMHNDIVQAYKDTSIVGLDDLARYKPLTENQGYTREVGILVGVLSLSDLALLKENIAEFERSSNIAQDELAAINAATLVTVEIADDIAVRLGLVAQATQSREQTEDKAPQPPGDDYAPGAAN